MDQTQLIEALEAEYQQLSRQRNDTSPSKPRIAAWGLVKAGKSSLLNMLSGHASDEYFETGVIRTTRANQALELADYVLVDTPGLGIDKDDSQQANEGLDVADQHRGVEQFDTRRGFDVALQLAGHHDLLGAHAAVEDGDLLGRHTQGVVFDPIELGGLFTQRFDAARTYVLDDSGGRLERLCSRLRCAGDGGKHAGGRERLPSEIDGAHALSPS